MAKTLQAIIFIFLSSYTYVWAQTNVDVTSRQGYRYHYLLVNSSNPKRYIKLYNPVLDLVTSSSDPKFKYFEDHHSGWIDSLDDSNLYFHVTWESIRYEIKNGYVSNTTTKYRDVVDSTYWDKGVYNDFVFRTIKIQSINYLKYSANDINGVQQAFGALFTFVGTATTFLVAPLVSINYKNGEFNTKRYYPWAATGLVSIAIGVPLIVTGNGTKYKITTKNKTRARNYWYFDRKLVN